MNRQRNHIQNLRNIADEYFEAGVHLAKLCLITNQIRLLIFYIFNIKQCQSWN